MKPFCPPWWLRGAMRQTVAGTLWPVPERRPAAHPVRIPLPDGDELVGLLDRSPAPQGRLLLLHGLGGSATSRYLLRVLPEALARGWDVLRLNARGAGQGGGRARGLAHAARWPDLAPVLAARPFGPDAGGPLVAAGFSLGGTILLRFLAEAGRLGQETGIAAAVAVNPPTDLGLCLEHLERARNSVYHAYYTCSLRAAIRRHAADFPGAHGLPDRSHRSVRRIDEDFIAPDAGFPSAAAYYEASSPRDLLRHVAVPTRILSSADDPFVPPDMLRRDAGPASRVDLALAPAGGHVGYLERRRGRMAFWAGEALLDLAGQVRESASNAAPAC